MAIEGGVQVFHQVTSLLIFDFYNKLHLHLCIFGNLGNFWTLCGTTIAGYTIILARERAILVDPPLDNALEFLLRFIVGSLLGIGDKVTKLHQNFP